MACSKVLPHLEAPVFSSTERVEARVQTRSVTLASMMLVSDGTVNTNPVFTGPPFPHMEMSFSQEVSMEQCS